MKFFKDKTGTLKKYFKPVIEEYFPHLDCLNFLFLFREGERFDDEGRTILASCRKLNNRDRDTFNFDCAIEVDFDIWEELSSKRRVKLAFHELNHVKLDYDVKSQKKEEEDEDSDDTNSVDDLDLEPSLDKEGRIKFSIRPHDINVNKFKADLEMFGLETDDDDLLKLLKKVKKSKKKKVLKIKEGKKVKKDKKKKKKKKKD